MTVTVGLVGGTIIQMTDVETYELRRNEISKNRDLLAVKRNSGVWSYFNWPHVAYIVNKESVIECLK